jgi:hypothetical protein
MARSFGRVGAAGAVLMAAMACSGKSDEPATPVADSGSGGRCAPCPSGYACGSANGLPVCRAPSGVPLFEHVFVILMENTSRATLEASTNTSYLHGLDGSAASGADYHGVAHPSLPNYLALVSGDTGGVICDCYPTGAACSSANCTALLGSCGCGQSSRTIGDQLEAAQLPWKAYAEDMGSPCNPTSSGSYGVRHVPFLYFDALRGDSARCSSHVVDFGGFAGDLAGTPPAFSFISPNLVSDMHDPFPPSATNYGNGDTWLADHAQPIADSAIFKKGGLLVIVWDEDDLSGFVSPDDPIAIYVMSPYAKSGGYSSTVRADHYSLLATIEDGLGLSRLGKAAAATPLTDYFPDN